MKEISEAVFKKVKEEAQGVLKEAKEKAGEEIARAEKRQAEKIEAEKDKLLSQARGEAARIGAQAAIEARQEVTRAKVAVIARVVDKATQILSQGVKGGLSADLIRETMDGLGEKSSGTVYVSAAEVDVARNLVAEDPDLTNRIVEIKKMDCMGGVVAEASEGKLRVDNTYEARLEMLLPRLLPEINEKLFKAL